MLLAAFAIGGEAQAQTPVCRDLQQQYTQLSRQGGGRGQGMVNMQRLSRELAAAQNAARLGNCQRFLFFGPRPSPQCPAINATIGRLQRDIAQARRGAPAPSRNTQAERNRLLQWMNQYGCQIPSAGSGTTSPGGGGGLRTVCVRVCDGYYFPVSFATSRQRVAQDAQVCQAFYGEPGKAEIFSYYGNSDISTAVSPSGQRYGDQPYAFAYRQAFNPQCAQELTDGIAALGQRYLAENPHLLRDRNEPRTAITVTSSRPAGPPMPNLRPTSLGEDPETAANRAGQLAIAPYVPGSERDSTVVASNGMRQVGAAYYAEIFDPDGQPTEPPQHRQALGFDLIAQAKAMLRDRRGDQTGSTSQQ